MNFILPFTIPSFPFRLNYRDPILLIGSCFSAEIGDRLKANKWQVLQNPNGILFDPISIAEALMSYSTPDETSEESLFELNGLWHSWKHHTSFSGLGKENVLFRIRQAKKDAHSFLKSAKLIIITLGTAYHYELKDSHLAVSNCHKANASLFNKKLLATAAIENNLSAAIQTWQQLNPSLNIIVTVSPVRYIKEGLIENNRSKARLVEAAHSLTDQLKNVYYFPSYELAIDVLRDYRFYKTDLVHPNEISIDYIYEKFCESLIDPASHEMQQQIQKIIAAKNHKVFFEKSTSHQNFVISQLSKIEELEKAYPNLNFAEERKHFSSF